MIIAPLRDFFIAILFAYLYYYKGIEDLKRQRENSSGNIFSASVL